MTSWDFTDPRTTPYIEPRSRGELPHLHKEGGSYFVTFRLWDAVTPEYERILALDPKVWTKPFTKENAARICAATEAPLRLGSCVLAQESVASLVQDSFLHFADVRYQLAAWSVMPNHVHVIFTPWKTFDPSSILHSWKSYTAHRINKLLGRQGTLWERESFDHLIRSLDYFEYFIHYIENNPVAAGLCARPEDWPWSSARHRPR